MKLIPVEMLQPGMIIARNVYNAKYTMIAKGTSLNSEYIKFIQSSGYINIYIWDGNYMDVDVTNTIDDQLFEAAVTAVANLDLEAIQELAVKIVDIIEDEKNINVDFRDSKSINDYNSHHSVCVAIYSVIIGRAMGVPTKGLYKLCEAGLCIDLGKQYISNDIINKPGRLTKEEFHIMKEHARMSFDILNENDEVSSLVKKCVLCHHENVDGTGYPLGIEGDEQHIFIRILHVVDAYNAMISQRPYKKPFTPNNAFEYLIGGKNFLFDSKVVDAMISVLMAYPMGIDVELSDGSKGVVVGGSGNALRPVVKIENIEEPVNMRTDEKYQDVNIVKSGALLEDYSDGKVERLNEISKKDIRTKQRIMIIDDTPMSMAQTKTAIGDAYEYICFENGLQCIDFLSKNSEDVPDLLIMDAVMPTIDGVTVAKKIRKNGFSKLPIVFLSSTRDREIVMACREINKVDYILKPANAIYLKERVDCILGNLRLNL